MKRKPAPLPFADSDSEIEDVKHIINDSRAQLSYTRDVYKKHLAMGLGEYLISSDCVSALASFTVKFTHSSVHSRLLLQGEIIATCERHIYGLEVIIDANDDTKVLPDVEVLEVKGNICI